jgi:hypothetical protein
MNFICNKLNLLNLFFLIGSTSIVATPAQAAGSGNDWIQSESAYYADCTLNATDGKKGTIIKRLKGVPERKGFSKGSFTWRVRYPFITNAKITPTLVTVVKADCGKGEIVIPDSSTEPFYVDTQTTCKINIYKYDKLFKSCSATVYIK